MTYSLEDIELMISDLPRYNKLSSLDESFTPKRRHLKAGGQHLPIPTRPRKIINSLIKYFQDNPIDKRFRDGSDVPFFLWDMGKFTNEQDVKRLMQIPNIELVRSGRMN